MFAFFLQNINRELDVLNSVGFSSAETTSTEVDLERREDQTGNRELVRVGSDKLIDSDTVVEGAVLGAVFLDRDACNGLTVFRVVVADVHVVVVTEGEDLSGGFEESLGAATGEVSAGVAHLGVEDGVTDEDHLLLIEDVGVAGGGVAGSVDDADLELADVEGVAFGEELVELGAVLGGVVGDVEDGDPVVEDLDDVGADADGKTDLLAIDILGELFLEVVRRGEVISVDVGLEDHFDIEAEFGSLGEDLVGGGGAPARGLDVVVEDGVDDDGRLGFLAPENVSKSTSFLFVEVFNASHIDCLFFLFC